MATYPLLNLVFLLAIAVYAWPLRRLYGRAWWAALIILVMLTIVFDIILIVTAIIGYDYTKMSGLLIGPMPVEDLAYTLGALLLAPVLWHRFNRKKL